MQLAELANDGLDWPALEITGLTADSRQAAPGYLFAALQGSDADGADFIDDAVSRGVVAVLAPPGVAEARIAAAGASGVQFIADRNPRRRLATLAARFFERQPALVAAITGPNGKSSVAAFTRQIWQRLGKNAASLGTIGIHAPDFTCSLGQTTPDPVTLHRHLADLAARGIDHLALEASSHGLHQYRIDGVRVAAAAFTNLTRDHLDYHETADEYLYAKMRLFGEVLKPGSPVVLNAADESYRKVESLCWARGHRVLSVGTIDSDLKLIRREVHDDVQSLAIGYKSGTWMVDLPLIGEFQVANALVAAGLVIATGGDAQATIECLGHLEGARGRMELVTHHPSGAPVFVDYAHTPDALENLLKALRPFTRGRLVVVFGCGGNRDEGKRPQMGAIATELADGVYVTDDNPRFEDPARIRGQIMAAAPGAVEVADRALAIAKAIKGLDQDDVLVLAGKGHEQGQIVAGVFNPFDDAREAADAIAEIVENRRAG